ncbi:MAG: serine/threonine-protein kinase [Candidatus Nanoarchaeia archaeon]|nr:serine/threonine-protein kinase [Candidatus Nanoarchaeia archaeon]
MTENQDLVDRIDPQLVFRKNLMRYAPRPVYQVEKEGVLYILKPFDRNDDWQRRHIERESLVLQGAHDIEGITHLVHDYGEINRYIAILKEFAEGEDLDQLGGQLNNTQLQSQVEETVRGLHDLGYASMDIRPTNIVIGPNESYAKIIDLGYCGLRNDVSGNEFERMKSNDFHSLERLA